ncbi:hypothetical protein GJ496_003106 [Pomphorhynchus laevis]|nr:hypothetical protein GJ496_003106 [Pomphorhynchus laevis]
MISKFSSVNKLIMRSILTCLYRSPNRRFTATSTTRNRTHFGFQNVSEQEKAHRVNEVFSNVAQKYDLMNDVMSVGIHRLWKNHFVAQLLEKNCIDQSLRMLDVAGGTGDIATRIIERYGDFADVTLLDINKEMLEYGQQHSLKNKQVNFVLGNAEDLPFENDQFDVYTIAFGIRNCVHIEKVIDEALRVLKLGGKFCCLEFSQFEGIWPLNQLYEWYSLNIIPVMGELIADDFKSYKYLVESIRQFPNQHDFCEIIKSRGFTEVRYENLSCGIAAITTGYKTSSKTN